MRQAKLYTGVPWFRMLLTAHALLPADSSLRAPDVEDMLAELQDTTGAAWAGELAAEIADPALKARFLIRQAELTPDAAVVGDLTWGVWESGRLPPDHVGWATSFMNQAGQYERVIRIVESRLRAREAVDAVSLQQLQFAYRGAMRPLDALRAETTDKPGARPAQSPTGTGFFSLPDVRQ